SKINYCEIKSNHMKQIHLIYFLFLLSVPLSSQELHEDSLKQIVNRSFNNIYKETLHRAGRVNVDSISLNKRKRSIEFHTNLFLSYLPMREETVQLIYDSIRFHLAPSYKKFHIVVFS